MNAILVLAVLAAYQPSEGPPTALGGDLTRKKLVTDRDRPLDFKESVNLQVAEKRRELIKQLEELLKLAPARERPDLLFRLGDLYSEESRAYPDDLDAQKTFARMAVNSWSEVIQRYPDYARTDEVLYALGKTLVDLDDGRRALIAFRRLVDKFPKSVHVPNAWVAFGDWYFEHRDLDKAIDAYRRVQGPLAAVAAYKLGWCFYNQNDFEKAMEQFRTVALAPRLERAPQGLAREARADFVRAFSRSARTTKEAHELFNVLVTEPEDLRLMNKQLASLYYDSGRDKDAALMFRALIDERPKAPEAIGYQNHVIECVLRNGTKQMVLQQIRRLRELGKPDERSEALISGIAVNWHNEAKRTKDLEAAERAVDAYAEYLAMFADHPRAYAMRFFYAEALEDLLQRHHLSGPEYQRVAKLDGKWRETAAYDAVLAYEALSKTLPPPTIDGVKETPLSPERRALLESCDDYLKTAKDGANVVEVTYKAARLLYEHNHLREAAERFHHLAVAWPDHKFGDDWACVINANLSLDALNLLKSYETMNAWAREYAGGRCAGHDEAFRDEQRKLAGQLAFKLCTTAQCFEAIDGELQEKAWTNVCVLYEKEHQLDKAISMRERLLRTYPRSELAPQNTWALAQLYEQTADFAKAADTYEAYPPTAPQARDAAFNASVLRGELGQWQRAIAARRAFLERWPKDKDAKAVVLSIADLYEKAGKKTEASSQLEAYAKAYPANAIEALGRVARLKEGAAARSAWAKVAALYDATLNKRTLSAAAIEAVARAKLVDAEDALAAYGKLKLKWRVLSNPAELRDSLREKTRALQALERRYIEIVALGQADPAVCALYKIGVLYEQLADAVEHPPVPPNAPPAVLDELKAQLPGAQMRAKATEVFDAAAKKAHELNVFNACSQAARTRLSGQRLEELPEMKVQRPSPDHGFDLLLNIER